MAQLVESLALGFGDFAFPLDENPIRDQNAEPKGLTYRHGASWIEQQAKLKKALAPLKKRSV